MMSSGRGSARSTDLDRQLLNPSDAKHNDDGDYEGGGDDDALVRIGCVCGGILRDYRKRLPLYWSDIRDAFDRKTLSSALFMFWATFLSTVALGVHVADKTNNRIGITEYLMTNSIAGMVHALVGGQPLLILRPTGPITEIIIKLSDLADTFDFDFYAYFAWTGVFVSIYMTAVASLEMTRWIKRLTRFTHELFAFFVCSIYIEDGISRVINNFDATTPGNFGSSMFSTIIAVLVFSIALFLHNALTWKSLTHTLRGFLSDYAATIAVIVMTLFSFAFKMEDSKIPRIHVPASVQPTCLLNATEHPASSSSSSSSSSPFYFFFGNGTNGTGGGNGTGTGGGGGSSNSSSSSSQITHCLSSARTNATLHPELYARAWPSPLLFSGMSPLVPLAAAASALPIVFFFYMDQNVSSLLTQQPSMKLRKGAYYHSSFLCMALFNLVGPLFGLSFVTGSLPHSPQLVQALTVYKDKNAAADGDEELGQQQLGMGGGDGDGGSNGKKNAKRVLVPERVAENRVAPFIAYLLIGLPLFLPSVIGTLPEGSIDGILTFVGVAGLLDTELWVRLNLLLRHPDNFEGRFRGVHWGRTHLYTFVQVALLGLIWGVNLSPVGLLFSVIVVGLVFFRIFVITKIFSAVELDILDSEAVATADGGGGGGGGGDDTSGGSTLYSSGYHNAGWATGA
eukprot:g6582.t1